MTEVKMWVKIRLTSFRDVSGCRKKEYIQSLTPTGILTLAIAMKCSKAVSRVANAVLAF